MLLNRALAARDQVVTRTLAEFAKASEDVRQLRTLLWKIATAK